MGPEFYAHARISNLCTLPALSLSNLSRARSSYNLVGEEPRAEISAEVVREISSLYPQAAGASNGDEDVQMVSEDGLLDATIDTSRLKLTLAKELLRLPRLSGTGPLNTRNEHITLLAKSSDFMKEGEGVNKWRN